MAKGIIFDLLMLNNGAILTLLKYFRIGLLKDNHGFGTFYTLMFAVYKLETSVSIAWRTKSYGEEKESQSKSKTPTASA